MCSHSMLFLITMLIVVAGSHAVGQASNMITHNPAFYSLACTVIVTHVHNFSSGSNSSASKLISQNDHESSSGQ